MTTVVVGLGVVRPARATGVPGAGAGAGAAGAGAARVVRTAGGAAVVAGLGPLVAGVSPPWSSAVVSSWWRLVEPEPEEPEREPDEPEPEEAEPFLRRSSPGSLRWSRGVRPPWSSLAEGLGLDEIEGEGVEVVRTTWPLAGTRTGTASENDALAQRPMTAGQTATVRPARTSPMRFMMSPESSGCEVFSLRRTRGPAPLGDGRSTS